MTAKLYQLTDLFAAALASADDDGELPEGFAERLDALELALDAKLDNCCRLIRQEQADAVSYEKEASRLDALAKAAWNRADALKAYVQRCLEMAGLRKMQTELFKLTICKNGRPATKLLGITPEELPTAYQAVTVKPDTERIVADWKAGKPLPAGVSVEVGSHVRIK